MAPGVAYYLEPLNLYLSGSVGLSIVTYDSNTNSSSDSSSTELTDWGFGASFMAGKEWWVSSNWGIGAATMLNFASMNMKDYDTRMTATSISLLFSATFN
jgi:opacity protein-like surface antigen